MFWHCAPLRLADQSWGSYTADLRELHAESPEVLHRCFTVHKIRKIAVFTVMFTLSPVRKRFPATQHTSLCSHMHSPFAVRAHCPQAAAEAWYFSQTAEHYCSHPSVQREFQHCNLVIRLPQLNLWPLWNVSLSSPSLPCYFVLFMSQGPWEEKKNPKGDTGPSGNFFLISSPFYTNISRCWDMGCSSCFFSHFKVYWLCRRWKLHSRLSELKAVCLPFDQTQILFCQI